MYREGVEVRCLAEGFVGVRVTEVLSEAKGAQDSPRRGVRHQIINYVEREMSDDEWSTEF